MCHGDRANSCGRAFCGARARSQRCLGGLQLASLIFVTDEGIANVSSSERPCRTITTASPAEWGTDGVDKKYPGVVKVVVSNLETPIEGAEVTCNSSVIVMLCAKRFAGRITYVSVGEAVKDDTDAQAEYLTRFLNTLIEEHANLVWATAALGLTYH